VRYASGDVSPLRSRGPLFDSAVIAHRAQGYHTRLRVPPPVADRPCRSQWQRRPRKCRRQVDHRRRAGPQLRIAADQYRVSIHTDGVRSAYEIGQWGSVGRKPEGMTLALDATDCAPRLHDSIQLMRGVISSAGYGVPAVTLHDRALAAWVRAQGITVTAHDDDELDLVQYSGIRPTQIVFRCGPMTDSIRRAVNLGVFRFVVCTEHQIARLSQCAQRTKYLYLDEHSPLVLGNRRLKVIGLHSDVDDSGGVLEWASVAERLLCRSALLKTCGSPIHRIMLSGGSTEIWLNDQAPQLTSIVCAVDEALREGCERWQLPRPAVTLTPSTATGRVITAA
jgi:hypothetical protein